MSNDRTDNTVDDAKGKAVDDKWCPTQGGTGSAWKPQYRPKYAKDPGWMDVPTALESRLQRGVPGPLIHGGVIGQIGMMGYAQAMALAWLWAAHAESRGEYIEVRVEEYELQYDIKARPRGTERHDG